MKTTLHLVICYLFSVLMAGAQVIYSSGTYTQDFNSLSSNTVTTTGAPLFIPTDNDIAWTDNSTVAGWYASRNAYTTSPSILGLGLTNQLTSSGSGGDRALGSYLGVLSGGQNIAYGVRIQNNLGGALTAFTLTFNTEGYTSGIGTLLGTDILGAFDLGYSTTASDVSGAGATGYQSISGLGGGLVSLNVLSQSGDTARLQVTVTGLNVANGGDLWLKWERGAVASLTNNQLATDDMSFSAVPEPGTYVLFGLGLMALVVLRRAKINRRSSKSGALLVLVTSLSLLPNLQAQDNAPSGTPLEETVVRSSSDAPASTTVAGAAEKAKNNGSAATHEYKPQWYRMMLLKDFNSTYQAELERGEIALYQSSHYFKSIRNYHVSTGNHTPPPVVWLRHDSYLIQKAHVSEGVAVPSVELPVARPNTLMPILDSTALFGRAIEPSHEDYSNRMFYLRNELLETTEKIKNLLKAWDTGSISSQEMTVLQSASRVEWVVCCMLVPERKDLDDLLGSLYREPTFRLNSSAMTPSMALSSGL